MSQKSSSSDSPDVLVRLLKQREENEKKQRMSTAKKEFQDTINAMTEEEIKDVFFDVNINNDFELEAQMSPPMSSIKVPAKPQDSVMEEIDLTMDDDSNSHDHSRVVLGQNSSPSKVFSPSLSSHASSNSSIQIVKVFTPLSKSSPKNQSLSFTPSNNSSQTGKTKLSFKRSPRKHNIGSTKKSSKCSSTCVQSLSSTENPQDDKVSNLNTDIQSDNKKIDKVSHSSIGLTNNSMKVYSKDKLYPTSKTLSKNLSSGLTNKTLMELERKSTNQNVEYNGDLTTTEEVNSSSSSKKPTQFNVEYEEDDDDDIFYDQKSSFFAENLKDFIDETHGKLYGKWESELLFDMKCGDQIIPQYNILRLIEKQEYKKVPVFAHFCPIKYPVHGGYKGAGFMKLLQDLQDKAGVGGFGINLNQPYTLQNSVVQRIVCKRHVPYQGDTKKRKKEQYRKSTLCNDRKNTRGKEGLTQPRRRPTFRAKSKEHKCPFRFNIGMKDGVFYVLNGSGCTKHEHHPKLHQDQINYPTKLLSTAEKELLIDLGKANANVSVGVNAIYEKTGKVLSSSNVRYLQGLHNELKPLDKMKKQSSPEDMIKYLQDNGYEHVLLTDNSQDFQLENTVRTDTGETSNLNVFSEMDQVDVQNFVTSHRKSNKVEPEQIMMVAIAWILPSEKRLAYLFPEVLCVDTTGDTNNESRPLLTVTGKYSLGKTFTVLRAFLPNEKAWVFNWIFSVVMPTLLGTSLMERVRHIICDGDPQECTQIDAAIARHFPQVTRGRCGFHLVNLGWDRYMGAMKQYKDKVLYKKVAQNLRNWIYSWMKPSCETEAEYRHSKHLFFKFLNTEYIRDNLGQLFIDNVTRFMNDSIIPQEPYFCFYRRKSTRHFEEYSNSPHEGTNNGLKHCASPVKPTHALAQSMVILSKNGERNIAKKGRTFNQSNNAHKVYSSIDDAADKLTPICAHILESVWKNRLNYSVLKVSPDIFLVSYIRSTEFPDEDVNEEEKMPRPIFQRVRTVYYDQGHLYCSCEKHERMGIPCSHIYAVLSQSSKYTAPSHHDCALRWWNMLFQYGLNQSIDDPNQDKVSMLLELLTSHDTKGVYVPKYYLNDIPLHNGPIPKKFEYDPNHPVCINYELVDTDEMKKSDFTGLTPNFTQTVFKVNENSDLTNQDATQVIEEFAKKFYNYEDTEEEVKPYTYLLPGFKAMCNKMPHKVKKKHLISYMKTMNEIGLAFEEEDAKKVKKLMKGYTGMVSSSVPKFGKRKTHGTKRKKEY